MSQNMLPFEPAEAKLFGAVHPMWLKMFLLRISQGRSFKAADGVIFLSEYARTRLCSRLKLDPKRTTLIPHGIEKRFFCEPRPTRPSADCSALDPFRLLYVSILMPYKHQLEVGQAVVRLRNSGIPVSIDFAGDMWGNYGKAVSSGFRRLDPEQKFLRLLGPVPFDQLHDLYSKTDAFIFASSCENLPNILLEAMAAGLPVACSNRGPMPEILGDAGVYFDPEQSDDIARAIERLYVDPALRALLASKAQGRARGYSWERCAQETLAFIAAVAKAECGS
jgi:glycosyltransferase involved in cell wall biosynthesis